MESTTLFNPLKVLLCLPPSLCVIQANQSASARTGKRSELLTRWFLLNWKRFSFFYIPPFPLFSKKRKNLFLVRDARCHWLNLRAADHSCVDNTSGKLSLSVSFFTVKCTLDWQPLAPQGEMPGWKVSSDNGWKADLMHFCSLERYSFKCFLVPLMWNGIIWPQFSRLPSPFPKNPFSPPRWTNGRFSVFLLKINRILFLGRAVQNKLCE